MSIAVTNRAQISLQQESVYGTPPNLPFQIMRFTSDTIKQTTALSQSTEIRSDRQVPDAARTDIGVDGDLGFELSASTYDLLLQNALFSAGFSIESTIIATDTTVSTSDTDNSFNLGTGTWSQTPAVGQWIQTFGFTNSANNGKFKVVSATSSKIIVTGGILITEAAGSAINISQPAQIVNGTSQGSFSIERKYTDLTNVFAAFVGMSVNSMSLSISSDQFVTGSFSFIGKSGISPSPTAPIGSGTYSNPTTNPVLSAVDNVAKILENNTTLDLIDFDVTINNNLRAQKQIGTLGPIGIGAGKVDVSGNIKAYFQDSTLMDKFIAGNPSSLAIIMKDSLGSGIILELPQIKFSAGDAQVGGQDQDVIQSFSYTAYRNSAEDVTIRIVTF